jgi:alpha-L-fucosidase 2
VYSIASTQTLPSIDVYWENTQSNASLVSSSCSAGQANVNGITQAEIGMTYKASARLLDSSGIETQCSNGTLTIPSANHTQLTLIIAADTNYDETHGTPAYNYSFRGSDPEPSVQKALTSASSKSPSHLLSTHLSDYQSLFSLFTLDLPDTANSSSLPTADLISRYNVNSTAGDPWLENLAFDYGRYLFISSSRQTTLPPNLQGKWAYALSNAWGADYHADVNLQMNNWHVAQTGLGDLQNALWEYMAETWAPRGAETAHLLYDAPGWVVHDEINIFGSSAMKTGDDYWADYPASGAWMMQHVFDHWDYYRNSSFLQEVGYPKLLKPVAQFWLSQLQEDQYFHDGTLVVNPCDSPEHGPTTFGCAHWQHMIYQVFVNTLQTASVVGETDSAFLSSITKTLTSLDKGLRIGSWGQLQEWKLDLDVRNDTHRHMSHLVAWFPGYALSSYLNGYWNSTIQSAVETVLWSRGPGIVDQNAGWEKVFRSACWARLNNSIEAYYELRLTVAENWAPNGLSMYSGKNEPFQIDANFGFPGAVLGMLVVDLPGLGTGTEAGGAGGGYGQDGLRTVVLGPAIPAAWGGGSVKSLRLRGGGVVDFSWDGEGVVESVEVVGKETGGSVRLVNVKGDELGEV